MNKKITKKIRDMLPIAVLVLVVILVIALKINLEKDQSDTIINDGSVPAEYDVDTQVNLLDTISPEEQPSDDLANEAIEAILATDKIKRGDENLKSDNSFIDSKKKISFLDIFDFFSQKSLAANNDQLYIETLAEDNTIMTQVNRVLDGRTSSGDFLSMSYILNEGAQISTYSQGDYVLFETDQSIVTQYRLDDNILKEYIVVEKQTPDLSFSFNLDYPRSHTLEPQSDGSIFVTKQDEGKKKLVWKIMPATIVDRKGRISEVDFELVNTNLLTYNIDPTFLDEADFPVVFDPSLEVPAPRFLHQMVWDDKHNQTILFGGEQIIQTYGYPDNNIGSNDTWTYKVGDVPDYVSDHVYDFTICLSEPLKLDFAVNDPIITDNSGYYTINTCTNGSCTQTEEITVNFDTNGRDNPVVSSNTFSGCFNIGVSGFGEAAGSQYSDAFYRYTDQLHNEIDNPINYTLGDGDNNFALIINGLSPAYMIPGHSGRWLKKYPPNSPSARSMFAMTWNSYNNNVVVYGGADLENRIFLNDTWIYYPPESDIEQGDWVKMTPYGSPGRLARAQMVWDTESNKAIMHSGLHWTGGLNGVITGDTYTFDPVAYDGRGQWSFVNSTGPSVYLHSMAWDDDNNQVILFGGDQCGTN